jgi:hypothetical protein
VTECDAAVSVVVVKVAFPLLRVPVPSVVPPSRNVTVPVAVDGVTVAVNFTDEPYVDGLAEDASVTVVLALLTVWVSVEDVLVL